MPKALPKARTCGKCTMCCWALGIDAPEQELKNEPFEKCKHQCATGCVIYETRPSPCATYRCMWLLGWADNKDRPDRGGLLVESPGAGLGIYVKEVKHGAAQTKRGKFLLAALQDQDGIFFTPFRTPDVTYKGSRETLLRIQQAAESGGLFVE